jgi:preprotein translocase subunit SecG
MQTILVVFHLFLAAGLIGLILIQHGKGADMGAAFGSGASGTVFGSKGSASFLTRLTAGLATLFFLTSMAMAYFATQRDDGSVVLDVLQQPAAEVEQAQPQTDLPSMPASSDVPATPVEENQEAAVPAVPETVVTDAPVPVVPETAVTDVPVPESVAAPAAPSDEPASQATDPAPAAAEADQPAEQKE